MIARVAQALIMVLSLCLRGAIRLYQLVISPLLGPRCRYHPSCSAYAMEAIQVHGPFKGFYLSVHRLLRCHPWGGSGYDPVPARQPQNKNSSHPHE